MNADSLPTVLELPRVVQRRRINVYCALQRALAVLDKAEFQNARDCAERRAVQRDLEVLLDNVK